MVCAAVLSIYGNYKWGKASGQGYYHCIIAIFLHYINDNLGGNVIKCHEKKIVGVLRAIYCCIIQYFLIS